MPTPLFVRGLECNMNNKIQELFCQIRDITAKYLIYQDRKIVELTRKCLPEINEFAKWFLEGNQFGIEEELYQGLSENLLYILQDVMEAIGQEDMVLLNDALAYGFIDYLKMFTDAEPEEESNDAV